MLTFMIAQAVTTVVPAPPSPPPIMTTRMVPIHSAEARRRMVVSVTLRSPDAVLWQGDLAVSQRGSARWQQSKSEAPAEQCGERTWGGDGQQNELSVNMQALGAEDGFSVQVRWTRPAAAPCGGTRIVELRATPTLAAGQTVTLSGDGGLVVELRRR